MSEKKNTSTQAGEQQERKLKNFLSKISYLKIKTVEFLKNAKLF